MPRWNIDKEILHLEERLHVAGFLPIAFYRLLIATEKMKSKGLQPQNHHMPGCEYSIYVFILEQNLGAPSHYYGFTIHEAFLKARKAFNNLIRVVKPKKGLTKPNRVAKI